MELEKLTRLVSEAIISQVNEMEYVAIQSDDGAFIDYEGSIDCAAVAACIIQHMPREISVAPNPWQMPCMVGFDENGGLCVTLAPCARQQIG